MIIINNFKNNKLFQQIFKFGIVGGIAFVIDYGIMVILKELLGFSILISVAFGFAVSVIFNYIASIKWVFDVSKKQTIKEFSTFIILSIIGLIINQLIMYIMVEKASIWYMFSKIVSTIIVMVYNFITRKIFIEKRK